MKIGKKILDAIVKNDLVKSPHAGVLIWSEKTEEILNKDLGNLLIRRRIMNKLFKVISAPESRALSSKELKEIISNARKDSEWEVWEFVDVSEKTNYAAKQNTP